MPAGALALLPKGGRVTPLLLRYAGGVQEDMKILGGVPPRAAVAFWTICTALLSVNGGRVRALALVLVPVSETEDVQTGVDEQHLEDVVGSACQQIRLISGRGAKAYQRLVRLRRIDGDRHVCGSGAPPQAPAASAAQNASALAKPERGRRFTATAGI